MDLSIALPFPLANEPDELVAASPQDETLWARAAAGGDKAAFGRLVDRYKAPVYGLCYRLLNAGALARAPAEEARDAAQETFVRAYTAIDRFSAGQPFGAWILRIARNHCIDLLRRRRPVLALVPQSRDEAAPSAGLVPEPEDPFAVSGEAAVQEREAQRDLEAEIGRLPPRYREVIALFHQQHRSYAEIAQVLDVPLGTVMTWLHRARKQLKARLSEHFS